MRSHTRDVGLRRLRDLPVPGIRRILVVAVAVVVVVAIGVVLAKDDPKPPTDPKAFCGHVARLGELVTAAASGPQEIADVPAAQALVDDIALTADALLEEAPEDIEEAADTLASVTAELARELRDFYAAIAADPARANDPTFLSSFDPLTEERSEAIRKAGDDVRPWVDDHC